MPLWNSEYWKYSFSHFSLTCFDILSWNFARGFVSLKYRSTLSVVNLRQFLWELCPFWNLEYLKYSFPLFSLHALTYWAEIFHMTFFNVLQIKFECRHSVSIHFIWNLKFDIGFFYAFLFRKVLNKNSFLKCTWRAYYAPCAVLGYICFLNHNHL